MSAAVSLLKNATESEVNDLVQSMLKAHDERVRTYNAMTDLYEGTEPISLPEGSTDDAVIHCGIPAQVIGVLCGLLSEQPKIKLYSGIKNQKLKAKIEQVESALNAVFDVMDQQGGPIMPMLDQDQCKFGTAFEAYDYVPGRLSDLPKREDHGYTDDDSDYDATGYLGARKTALQQKSYAGRKLPISRRQIDPDRFLWRSSDGMDLSLTVEIRTRYVKDVLEDKDRYGGQHAPRLRKWYEKDQKDNSGRLNALCNFLIIQDHCTTITAVMSGDLPKNESDKETWTSSGFASQQSLVSSYGGLEIIKRDGNPLGRPAYVATWGLQTTSKRLAYRYRGIFFDARHLIRNLDAAYTWRLQRLKDFVFAPVISTSKGTSTNGVASTRPLDEEPGGQIAETILHRGKNKVTDLPDGRELTFLTNPGGGPEEMGFLADIRSFIELLTITSKLLDAGGDSSGYLYESLSQTVLSRFNQILFGKRLAHVQRVLMVLDLVRIMGEPLPVGVNNPKTKSIDFVEIDPGDIDAAQVNVEAIYSIRKPQNGAQNIANYRGLVESGATTPDRARSEALGYENSAEIEEDLAIVRALASEDMQKIIMNRASAKAGLLDDQEQAEEEGDFTIADLMASSDTLAKALAALVPAGSPGFNAIQQYQQMAQQTPQVGQQTPGAPPPPSGVPGGMLPPGMKPIPGGPQAGAARSPGGPRRVSDIGNMASV